MCSRVKRPAHQWRNGSDLSLLLASDAAAMKGQGPATCLCWRGAKCQAFRFLGPLRPGVGLFSYGAPTNDAEENRLIWRTAVSSQSSSPRLGGNFWSRHLKVRRLLKPARLDRRLSLTPPISMDSLSSVVTHKAISLNAHCLLRLSHQILVSTCLSWRDSIKYFPWMG